MRIGIDARTLYAPAMKGIGIYVQNLLPAMAELDPASEFVLLYDTRQDCAKRLPAGQSFADRGIAVRKGDTFYAWEQLRMPVEIRRMGVDLFHSPANTTSLWRPAPTVVTVHDVKLLDMPAENARAEFYHKTLQKMAVCRAASVICPSEFTKREVLSHFRVDERRVIVIYNGISPQFHVSEDREQVDSVCRKLGIGKDFILTAGGESGPKNISNLIAAFAQLLAGGVHDVLLVVPGIRTESILRKHQAEAEASGVAHAVMFPGYLPQSDLIALMNAALLFVYPSLSEGFGFPPLEAMACGVPVAASNATSIPEVVGDAALLFDGRSVNDMAAAIERLLSDQQLREEQRRSGFRRAAKFTWTQAAEATLDVYDRVAAHSREFQWAM
jgi:glycosyltransferase involved in cell wall biosynthesis